MSHGSFSSFQNTDFNVFINNISLDYKRQFTGSQVLNDLKALNKPCHISHGERERKNDKKVERIFEWPLIVGF
jgi:hypothetical protein